MRAGGPNDLLVVGMGTLGYGRAELRPFIHFDFDLCASLFLILLTRLSFFFVSNTLPVQIDARAHMERDAWQWG